MSYRYDHPGIVFPNGSFFVSTNIMCDELNRLLAERDEARRDRDVLGRCLSGGKVTVGEMDAALSRCTPPATEPTNG